MKDTIRNTVKEVYNTNVTILSQMRQFLGHPLYLSRMFLKPKKLSATTPGIQIVLIIM